jgi:ABC-type sugar transport system ATPase subunit
MSPASDIVFEARGISKSFPGVKALDDVSVTLRRGRLTALLGENGAGKSTLMNIVGGVFPPDAGTLWLEGREVRFTSTRDARDAGIAMIFQELNLIPQLTVAENIFLDREPLTRLGLLDNTTLNRNAAALLDRLELRVTPTARVGALRVGQQQVVEIARALSCAARVIVMDEPTSALSEHEIAVLFDVIAGLKRDGVAIAFITHKLDELDRIGDDAVILRDGKLMGAAPLRELARDDIIRKMVGRELGELYQRSRTLPGEEVLRVEGLTLRHPDRLGDVRLRDVSFRVRQGEVLGLFRPDGRGPHRIARNLVRPASPAIDRQVFIGGRPDHHRLPRRRHPPRTRPGPEDRKREGLVLEMSVAANTSLASLGAGRTLRLCSTSASNDNTSGGYLERFHVKTPSLRPTHP